VNTSWPAEDTAGRGREQADRSSRAHEKSTSFRVEQVSAPPSPAQVRIPPFTRIQFPNLTDEQWRERRRKLKRRHIEFWQEHPREFDAAFVQPRPANVIDFVMETYKRLARDERRRQRRAGGKFY
jgi:hypothetical protein